MNRTRQIYLCFECDLIRQFRDAVRDTISLLCFHYCCRHFAGRPAVMDLTDSPGRYSYHRLFCSAD